MSIIDAFDNGSEELLKPGSIVKPVENFPKTVIMTFRYKILESLKANYDVEEISELRCGFKIPVYRFRYKGNVLGMYMTVVGGPATTGLLEEVIAKGAEKFLVFGSCGVLDNSLAAGHLIIPTAAYRDEGTSYHYMPPSDYVEVKTAKKLGGIFETLNIPYIYGKTWTTDAGYRETRNRVDKRKKEGCLTVEMECASVMAASQFRGVPVYQFLYAEDSLGGEAWDARTMGNVPQSAYDAYLRIALETAIRL